MNIKALEYKELVKAIKENNLVLFVGARLSHDFVNRDNPPKKLGDWNNLVKEIIVNVDGLDYLEPILNLHDPLDILGLIDKTEQKSEVIDFVKNFFSLPDDGNEYSLHKKLCSLSNIIITTNYDNAFEIADPDLRTKTAYLGKNFELTKPLLDPSEKILFKLHGCINDGERIILFPSDYTYLYGEKSEEAERIIFHLKNLIVNKTILFIGYGMSDFQIKNIFSEQYRILGKFYKKKHYIITRKKELDSTLEKFLEPITIDDTSKKDKEFMKQIGTIIDELSKIKDEKDEKKVKLEKELEEVKKELKNENDRIKIHSLEYAIEGLELALKGDFEKSIEKLKVSTEFNPDNAGAFNNWGTVLSDLAKIRQNDENLFNQAFEKYDRATQINPEDADVFNNWGAALYDLAKIKQNDENLFNQAIEKYDRATQINPEYAVAFYGWGNALSYLAIKQDDENLFNRTFEKFEKAYKINPEFSYDLACCLALIGKKEKALYYLEESLKNKTIETAHVLNDENWKNYHSDVDFINLINKYK